MLNMLESKSGMQNYVLKLKESDFCWLIEECKKRKQQYQWDYGVQTFEQFADNFLKDLLEKMKLLRGFLHYSR
jgi:hypothetical protein